MSPFVGLLALFLSNSGLSKDSADSSIVPQDPDQVPASPALHVLCSAFGTAGGYSTSTDSRSLSAYFTLSHEWRDYYTLGYVSLWLSSADAGGKYYSQQLAVARGSWLLSDRVSAAAHYAYLNEGAIHNYSDQAAFHWVGGGTTYWFSQQQLIGVSLTLSLSGGKFASEAYRAVHSLEIGGGVWATSMAVISAGQFTARLFSFRQSVSIPVGGDTYVVAMGDVGRRGFYFDDESLVAYNQRTVQTGSIIVKGIVHILGGAYLIPTFEYNSFDEYNVKYGSIGIRMVF